MSAAVNLSRAWQLSSHIHNMCSEAREAIYTREADVKHWLDKGQWSSYLCFIIETSSSCVGGLNKMSSLMFISLYRHSLSPQHSLSSQFLSKHLLPLCFSDITPSIISGFLLIRLYYRSCSSMFTFFFTFLINASSTLVCRHIVDLPNQS